MEGGGWIGKGSMAGGTGRGMEGEGWIGKGSMAGGTGRLGCF